MHLEILFRKTKFKQKVVLFWSRRNETQYMDSWTYNPPLLDHKSNLTSWECYQKFHTKNIAFENRCQKLAVF